MRDSRTPNECVKCLTPMRRGWGKGCPINYKSPRKVGVVVKALEGREERQGLDLRRCVYPNMVVTNNRPGSILNHQGEAPGAAPSSGGSTK